MMELIRDSYHGENVDTRYGEDQFDFNRTWWQGHLAKSLGLHSTKSFHAESREVDEHDSPLAEEVTVSQEALRSTDSTLIRA